jgi:hypothetical protein
MKSLAQLLGTAWDFYRQERALLLGYSAWILVPYVGILFLETAVPEASLGKAAIFVLTIMQAALVVWAVIAIMILTWAATKKKTVRLDAVGRRAWQRAPVFILVQVVNSLIVIGGSLLLLIPGFMFWVWYAFSAQELVLHKQHGLVALSASRNLVRGRFWPVAWRLIGGHTFLVLAYLFLTGALVGLASIFIEGPITPLNPEEMPLWLEVLVNIIEIVFLPLVVVFSTILYADLRQGENKIDAS